jgi:hypothetical protein
MCAPVTFYAKGDDEILLKGSFGSDGWLTQGRYAPEGDFFGNPFPVIFQGS